MLIVCVLIMPCSKNRTPLTVSVPFWLHLYYITKYTLCQEFFEKFFEFFENIFRTDSVKTLSFQHTVEKLCGKLFSQNPLTNLTFCSIISIMGEGFTLYRHSPIWLTSCSVYNRILLLRLSNRTFLICHNIRASPCRNYSHLFHNSWCLSGLILLIWLVQEPLWANQPPLVNRDSVLQLT